MEKLRLAHISKDEFLRVCGKCYMAAKQTVTYGVHRVLIADVALAPAPKAEDLAYRPAPPQLNQPPPPPPTPQPAPQPKAMPQPNAGAGGTSKPNPPGFTPTPPPPGRAPAFAPAPPPGPPPVPARVLTVSSSSGPPPVPARIPSLARSGAAGAPPPPPAYFSLEALQTGVPAGVDAANKELYLVS
jgi:hypothetical protein